MVTGDVSAGVSAGRTRGSGTRPVDRGAVDTGPVGAVLAMLSVAAAVTTFGRCRGSGMWPAMGAAAGGASVDAVWVVVASVCGDPPKLGGLSAFGLGHAKPPLPGAAGVLPEVLAAIRGAAPAGWV